MALSVALMYVKAVREKWLLPEGISVIWPRKRGGDQGAWALAPWSLLLDLPPSGWGCMGASGQAPLSGHSLPWGVVRAGRTQSPLLLCLVVLVLSFSCEEGARVECGVQSIADWSLSTLNCHSTSLRAFHTPLPPGAPPRVQNSPTEQALCLPKLQMGKLRHREDSHVAEVLRLGVRCRV